MTRRPGVGSRLVALVLGPALLLLAPGPLQTGSTHSLLGPTSLAAQDLERRVEGIVGSEPLRRVHWGLLLMEASTGEILLERNADLLFAPASNQKIPVAAAALSWFGPAYRFETRLLAELPVDPDGRITGDLYLPALGDPSLGPPYHPSADAAMQSLADSLVAAGVRRVEGALVVDVSAWDSTSVPTGWLVGNLPRTAAATGGAFAIGLGELTIEVTGAAAAGQPARVGWRPLGTGSFVESRVMTVPPGGRVEIEDHYLPESRRWVLEGTITPGARRTLTRAQRDPVRQAVQALYRALEGRGIALAGGVRILWDRGDPVVGDCLSGALHVCTGMVPIAGLRSPPLVEIVTEILGASQNWMAEQLVRALGAAVEGEGSWDAGFDAVARILVEEAGVDPLDLYFRDGSGLAGYNLVSPRGLGLTLRWAAGEPWGPAFRSAMAEPGNARTTLRARLPGYEGRVFAKTGTITHSNALSGYLVSDTGQERIFVVLTNAGNLPAATIRGGIDRVVREFARE